MSFLEKYYQKVPKSKLKFGAVAYMAALDQINQVSPLVVEKIISELRDQRSYLKLIASENYSSLAVQLAMGNLLTDKYSEGYPYHRFYAGCDNVDAIEDAAVNELKNIFGAQNAYVQPHSGADANLVAILAILTHKVQDRQLEILGKKSIDDLTPEEYEKLRELLLNQKLMGMSLRSGGHLTHGYKHNISGKLMRSVPYEVDPKTELIDYADLQKRVKKEKPTIIIAGYSSYSRKINFAKMREIADSIGAVLLVDMAHFSGLVAGKIMTGEYNPVPFAEVVTSTTHKTLRGPRGGFILSNEKYKEVINKGCPLVLGGPLQNVIAAKLVAFKEANTLDFCKYAQQVVKNSQALAKAFLDEGVRVISGGTDNHMLVIDVAKSFKLNGRQAELALRRAGLTANRNIIFDDKNGPWYTSGVRLGTPALTTLGMKEREMNIIAKIIISVLKATHPLKNANGELSQINTDTSSKALKKAQEEVKELLTNFPLYPELIID